jgi:hypothetical protein
MQISVIIALLALITLSNPSEAKITKHWVLKQMMNGNLAQYIAFNTPHECEIARRRWISAMAKVKSKFKNQVGLTINADGECLDYIPLDYEIRR